MKSKVLLTGSSGFIGSHLFSSAPDDIELITISHRTLANPSFDLPKVDYIIHAAGYAAPSLFMKQPLETIQVNTTSIFRLLGCFKDTKGTFLFCSSSEIYRGLTHAATEDEIGTTDPYHPRACYIEGKRCGETIMHYCRDLGFRAMSARIGLTYGPKTKAHDARVLNQLIEQALVSKKILLKDNGSATVSYTYSDDLAKMLWNLVLNGTQPVYNVAGNHTTTIRELALRIGLLLDVDVSIPSGPDGSGQAQMNLNRYYTEFGEPAYTSFADGLSRTIDYQRGLYGVL